MKVHVEVSGGLELLFGKVKDHTLELPAAPPASDTGTATATATASTAATTKAGAATTEGTATATTTAETTDASATAAGSGAGGGAGAGAASDGSSSGSVWTMKELIKYIVDNTLQERPELFTVDDTVRPGILVLINDVDWELEGRLEYELEDGDSIAFISTLHGG